MLFKQKKFLTLVLDCCSWNFQVGSILLINSFFHQNEVFLFFSSQICNAPTIVVCLESATIEFHRWIRTMKPCATHRMCNAQVSFCLICFFNQKKIHHLLGKKRSLLCLKHQPFSSPERVSKRESLFAWTPEAISALMPKHRLASTYWLDAID